MAEDSENNLNRPAPLGASSEVVRILFVSALAVILLAGGVYWLHHQVPAPNSAADAGASTIQVRLMPATEPTPYPLAAEEPDQSASMSISNRPPVETTKDAQKTESDTVVFEATTVRSSPPAPAVLTDTAAARRGARERALKFQQALLRHIARYQRYPESARAQGVEGTVQVVFLLRRDGTIVDAWVQSTSGQTILDREALATVRRAEPLPVIPSDLPDQLSVRLPVAFELP